jgi:TolB-like protein
MSLFHELSRRNVFRVGAAYAVTAWLLIQVAETIFPLFGFDETPARIVVLVLVIGFVPALVFAWAFEITPEGVKREKEIDHSRAAEVRSGRNFDRYIALGLALALGYFAIDKFVFDPVRDAALVEEIAEQTRSEAFAEPFGENSIAVLPFANLSDDPEQEYFSDGIAEELLTLLAQVPGLRVISRSSSFAFRNRDINVPEVARQLGVNHVIEGSVRKYGERIRITVQCIEARSDTNLWSQTYERQLNDVFAVQDEISAAIVSELGSKLELTLSQSARDRAPGNTDAYEAYLRGRYLMGQRSPETLAGAIEEFGHAIELDPDYALGHASLAIALGLSAGVGLRTEDEAVELGRFHADRALQLNPGLAEAHAARGWVLWQPATIWEAEKEFRRAIEINPGYSEAHMWLGHFLMHRNEYAEAFDLYESAEKLDPLSIPAKNNLVGALLARGRTDEARRVLDKMASLSPEAVLSWQVDLDSIGGNWADGALAVLELMDSRQWPLLDQLQVFFALMGMDWEARADAATLGLNLELLGEMDADPVMTLPLLGRPADAVVAWESTPQGMPQQPGPGYLPSGILLAAAGEFDRAREVLERAWVIFLETAGIGAPSRDANFMLALIASRRAMGDEAGIPELRKKLAKAVHSYRAAGMVKCSAFEGCVHFDAGVSAYLDGRREEGLALITQSVESGYFIPPNQAHFQLLYDDPGFGQILERQLAHQAKQREKFLALVCGENPYPAVWQPVAETCSPGAMLPPESE